MKIVITKSSSELNVFASIYSMKSLQLILLFKKIIQQIGFSSAVTLEKCQIQSNRIKYNKKTMKAHTNSHKLADSTFTWW